MLLTKGKLFLIYQLFLHEQASNYLADDSLYSLAFSS